MLRRCVSKRLAAQLLPSYHTGLEHGVLGTVTSQLSLRNQHYATDVQPLRKQLKDAAKASRGSESGTRVNKAAERHAALVAQYELTVGIEIHAQLNTGSKLFSHGSAEYTEIPNAALWPFDIAVPGSQPLLQFAVLVPALRAALALNCQVQDRSKFDRKHYFYHDQPAGYQITQYYEPFAKDGQLVLRKEDGLGKTTDEELVVGIKQIQLEQDTAKTIEQDDGTTLIDFNRSGHALIEIISLPQIHSPEAAAAYVRKIQSILFAVDAATTGMDQGGLRADVNVSVRKLDDQSALHSYAGVSGLGQRTEIKNLSSFKSVLDAVKAERDRQILLLESGGHVLGETRGWSLANPTVTRRLRGKEGEVDYRYMPDPDISPLHIASDLVDTFRANLPPLPDELITMLQDTYGLSRDDAQALLALDDGERMLFFQDVVGRLTQSGPTSKHYLGVSVGNWVLHELGALLTTTETTWRPDLIMPQQMADLIQLHLDGRLTGASAKALLRELVNGDTRQVSDIAESYRLFFSPLSDVEYDNLVRGVVEQYAPEADVVRRGGKQAKGKLKFLLGQAMRSGDRNRIEPKKLEAVLQAQLQAT